MDRVETILFAGGLDEASSASDAAPGSIARSLNYEVIASGGYRRIGGMRRWSGGDVSVSPDAVVVLSVSGRLTMPIGTFVTSSNGVRGRVVASKFQAADADSFLVAIERDRATDQYEVGAEWTPYFLPGSVVLDLAPTMRAVTRDSIRETFSTNPGSIAQAAPGDGPVVLLAQIGPSLVAIRTDGEDAGVYRAELDASPLARGWSLIGRIADVGAGQWASVRYRFASDPEAIYVVNGRITPHRITLQAVTIVPAPSGATHITAHQESLFLGFDAGNVLHSKPGEPDNFDASQGAGDIQVGAAVTGFAIVPGDALAIFCAERIRVLQGSNVDDWTLQDWSDRAGAIPGTIANLPTTVFADRRGISTFAASDTFGNFTSKTLSQRFDATYQRIVRSAKVYATTSREKSQYRLFNQDGRALYLTFGAEGMAGAAEVDLGVDITSVCSVNDDEEQQFIGTADGWVYRLDVGNDLDGRAIGAFLQTPPYDYGTSRSRKRFSHMEIELTGDPGLQMSVANIIDGGGAEQSGTVPVETDEIDVDAVSFRDELLNRFSRRFYLLADLVGSGLRQAIRLDPTSDHSHELHAMTVHTRKRGQRRR